MLGEREHGMRLWVDPDRLYRLGMTPTDVSQAERRLFDAELELTRI
jgi:multidrug efflux pump subunit AcrB